MNAAAPYGAPVAIPIACVTIAAAVALLAIGIAWARRATAPYGTHCKPRPERERSPLRTAVIHWHPVRGLKVRRWCAGLRRDNAELAQQHREFTVWYRQWWLRFAEIRSWIGFDTDDDKLRARAAAASARPGQAGTAPATPASGAVPHHLVRDDGVIKVEPDGGITVRPRTYDWSPLRDTAADGIAVVSPALVRPYVYREGL